MNDEYTHIHTADEHYTKQGGRTYTRTARIGLLTFDGEEQRTFTVRAHLHLGPVATGHIEVLTPALTWTVLATDTNWADRARDLENRRDHSGLYEHLTLAADELTSRAAAILSIAP